jgi:Zn-dependent protease
VLLDALSSREINVPMMVAIIIVLFFSMGIHEYAHCLMATWWGDTTPREMGRLTPNPLVHIYWPGFIMFLFLGFGILGSAPVNPRRMRDPRWGSFWTSAAGPLSNLLIAIVVTLIYRLFSDQIGQMIISSPSMLGEFLFYLLFYGIITNVLLFVFNLLPFFPLDGWHMVLALLPSRFMDRNQVPQAIRQNVRPLSSFLQAPAFKWQDWAQVSQMILIALVVIGMISRRMNFGIDPLNILISQPVQIISSALMGR